jgi:hypothetical protein
MKKKVSNTKKKLQENSLDAKLFLSRENSQKVKAENLKTKAENGRIS